MLEKRQSLAFLSSAVFRWETSAIASLKSVIPSSTGCVMTLPVTASISLPVMGEGRLWRIA